MGAVDPAALDPARWSGIRQAFGMDLGEGHAVVVHRQGRQERVLFEGDPQADAAAWQQALAEVARHSEKAWTVAAVAAAESTLRPLKTGLASLSKARRVLPGQLDVELPFPIEECVYAFLNLRKHEGGSQALAVCLRERELETRLQHLRERGIVPDRLDHEALALWPDLEERQDAACYLGADRSMLRLGANVQVFRQGLSEETSGDLARRMNRVIKAQASAPAPTSWTWCGPRAEAAAREGLQQALEIEVPFLVDTDSAILARALARRALEPGPTACNLLGGDQGHAQLSARRNRAERRTAVLVLAAGLLLIGSSVGWNRYLETRMEHMQEALSARARAITGLHTSQAGAEVDEARNILKERSLREASFLDATGNSGLDTLPHLLAFVQARGIHCHRMDWQPDRLQLAGQAADKAGGLAIKTHLEARGYTVDLKQAPLDSGRMGFTCEARRS